MFGRLSLPPMDAMSGNGQDEEHDSEAALAAGLGCLVGPVLRKCTASVETARKSQQSLEEHVVRLNSELDKMLEGTPLPMLSQHASRLASVHMRVVSLTANLLLIQGRIASINGLLDSHEAHGNNSASSAPQPPSAVWAFLRTTALQDGSTANKVGTEKTVTQDALTELLTHLKVYSDV